MPDTDDETGPNPGDPDEFENIIAARQHHEAESADWKRESVEADLQRENDDLREQLRVLRELRDFDDKQRAELRAEVERLTDAMTWGESKAHEDAASLRVDNQRLTEQVAELRADHERLNWLERIEGLTTKGFVFSWFREDGPSLREAIDEAATRP